MPINNPVPLQVTQFGRDLINRSGNIAALELLGFPNLSNLSNDAVNAGTVVNSNRNGFEVRSRHLHGRTVRLVDQSIPHNVTTSVAWDDLSYNATFNFANMIGLTAQSNTRITIRQAGIYLVSAHVFWQNNTNGTVRLSRIVRTRSGNSLRLAETTTPATPSVCHTCSLIDTFQNGDILELNVFQNSGVALSILIGTSFAVSQLYI